MADIYHVLNRGVDKRVIFEDRQDYARFVHDMFEFNDTAPANHTYRVYRTFDKTLEMADVGRRPLVLPEHNVSIPPQQREKLVDIHGWCLMGNHYHLLLSELVVGGLVLFLKKLNGGYAKYFNTRYKRVGTLFQGRTKKILIDSDAHFLHILNYIHFNPLDMHKSTSDWRSRRIPHADEALAYLKKYRWSSYLDYIGIKNFPSILTTSLFSGVFNNNYCKHVEKYLQSISTTTTAHLYLE